jgi:TorA-specific chaperone
VGAAATEARSSMYRLLASFFARELTQENIVGFQNGNGSHLLDALLEVETYAPFTTYLKTFFFQITDPQQAVLDLAESYAWNFHGVGGPGAAPLYASVYLSKSGATHQQAERELGSIIRRQGLSSDNPDMEAYDHLSVILEFIAWLDEKEESAEQGILAQELRTEIIDKYLLSWLPAFVSQCTDADQPGFYSDLAVATLAFTQADFTSMDQWAPLKAGCTV